MLESELNRMKVMPAPSTSREATEGILENMYGDSYGEDETPRTRTHGIHGNIPRSGICEIIETGGKDKRTVLRVTANIGEICGYDHNPRDQEAHRDLTPEELAEKEKFDREFKAYIEEQYDGALEFNHYK